MRTNPSANEFRARSSSLAIASLVSASCFSLRILQEEPAQPATKPSMSSSIWPGEFTTVAV